MTNIDNSLNGILDELSYLRSLLDENGIEYDYEAYCKKAVEAQECHQPVPLEITPDMAKFFFSMFHGRVDVYAKRSKDKGYFPQCENFWKWGLCPKKEKKKTKCSECNNRVYSTLNSQVLMKHMIGEKEDCTDVLGVYVMLKDDTCRFIVFDFDNHDEEADAAKDWQDEVDALRKICSVCHIDYLVERSRSGKGAHLWVFFSEAVPAEKARKFGNALITKGAESVSMKSFQYYDRMLPMQDSLPDGGLGNLIALPWQGRAMRNGNSVFVDEQWRPLPNQMEALKSTRRLSLQQIEEYTNVWCPNGDSYVDLSTKDEDRPKDLFTKQSFDSSDATGKVNIILGDGLYIDKRFLKPRIQNAIRRLAAYSNPEFYKTLGQGFSTIGIPRIVYCGYDDGDFIVLPRGCGESLFAVLNGSGIDYSLADKRQNGRHLNVSFKGNLYPEQLTAAEALLSYDNGILNAATSFGKTVVGAYLIGERKVNTLILVHTIEIMNRWVEELNQFLIIDEETPTYITPTGRIKHRKSLIGTFSSQKNALTGIVDVAMISSLGKDEDINPIVKEYGMVIMDECHHAAAYGCESVLRAVSARCVYGMTATMKRDDGQERKIFMQLGPVRHKYTALERAEKQGIGHYVYPRFTRVVNVSERLAIGEAFSLVTDSEMRNLQIVNDTIECIKQGRTPIVMTKRKDHAAKLYGMLQGCAQHVFLLQGGGGLKERESLRQKMASVPKEDTMVAVAIGQYIGEGFNYPRLDTLLLAMPISFENNVEQYAGRLNRDYEGKKDVIIFDYIDQYVPMLENMYHKRLRTYKRIGFEICLKVVDRQNVVKSIFGSDNYRETYDADIQSTKTELIISSPGLGSQKVWQFVKSSASLQERGIRITVLTLSASSYPDDAAEHQEELISVLRNSGISVHAYDRCHEHFAIIDGSLVWYGSMNLLSRVKDEDNMMRIDNKPIAQELLENWARGL